MATPIDIRADHLRIVHNVLARHLPDGVKVWVFGSRATWATKDSSDLDLALEGDGEISRRSLSALEAAFEDSDLPFAVDVVDFSRIGEAFRRIVAKQRVQLMTTRCTGSGFWPTATIEEVSTKVAMGPFGSSIKVATFVPDGVPIISGKHLHGIRLDDSPGFNFITPQHAQRLANANVQRGDIILTHRGNIGQVSYIPEDSQFDRYVVSQSQFYIRCNRSRTIPEFVALYLTSPEGQHQLLANTSQVGVPSIAQPVTYLRTLEVPLPSPPEQRAIAHILGTLDDKIELNRRMNATLEAMARALFKSWFVDFDPVRAKMEGRDTGLPKNIVDLFPDWLVESEIGRSPEGWPIQNLADHFETTKGVSYKGSGLRRSGMPLHNLNSIREGGGYKYEGIKHYTGDYAERHVVRPGDVIVANTEQGHDRLLIGYAAIVPHVFGDRGICSHHTYRMRPQRKRYLSVRFLHMLLNSRWMHDVVSGYANGTTVNMLPIDALQKPILSVPPRTIIEAFDTLALDLEQRRERIVRESHSLGILRDVLLPKLVSGELSVR